MLSLNLLLNSLEHFFVFVIGLALGSFFTALASRILYFFYGKGRARGKELSSAIWKKIFLYPSFCMTCQKKIAIADIIPLWSYLKNRGKCPKCQSNIAISNFLGEVYLGLLALILFANGMSWPLLILTLLFCGQLYISLLTDFRFFILDAENTLCLFIWTIAYLILGHGFYLDSMQDNLIAFSGTLLCFGVLFIVGKMKSMGLGDVFLAAVIALFLGIMQSLLVFQFAALASIVYIVFIKKKLRSPAPLGAAMALGVLIIILVFALHKLLMTSIY